MRLSPSRVVIGELGYTAFFAALLFAPARTVAWPRAWILVAVMSGIRTVGALRTLRVNESLLIERSKIPFHRDQSLADKLLLPAFMLTFAGLVAFISVDRFYLHLLHEPDVVVSSLGLVAFAAGWVIVGLTVRTNAFATTVVRHQADREQRVIDHGVYGLVRHPMYSGMIVVMIGMGLWLESTAGALLSAVPTAILTVRLILEERVLRNALPGYAEYTTRVRSRLIPFVW